MNTASQPPHINPQDKVILFDGVCKLCHAWSRFIIKYDRCYVFTLCNVQSDEGKAILRHFGFPSDYYETMLYVEGGRCFQKSEAFFNVIKSLGYPWKALCLFRIIPQSARDWLYDRIALNRYRLFGRYDTCLLPTADHEARFLNEQ
ncbi:thiol-disulfide oxidoreductase DCC family protein [Eionea flava]